MILESPCVEAQSQEKAPVTLGNEELLNMPAL